MNKIQINGDTKKKKESIIAEKKERIEQWKEIKLEISSNFIDDRETVKAIQINSGEIFECFIGENIGEEQCKTRPVLILSKTFYNNNSTQVLIAPLSTTIKTKKYTKGGNIKTRLSTRTHLLLKKDNFSFLKEDSVVKFEQIRSVSKVRFTNKLGSIDEKTLSVVKNRIKDLFDICQ
ncbi:type II toxin-antitoxin system PemK/MazF family toxin [Viridibacillus sp. NPDC096237]|uniref:type II toxin-antitoxin system PemK/MazF family toxin n=1 Tax=Viridibacillus sp. NPDC096237 TaxID=3390721 RepID=UPI003CFD5F89